MHTRQSPRILSASIASASLILAATASAVDGTKADNVDDLSLSSSWTAGIAPAAAGIAIFDSTITAAQTYALGDNLTWGGISVTSPGGLQTIVGTDGKTLTLGSSGIAMGSATTNLTIGANIVLGSSQEWAIGSGRSLTVSGAVSGASGVNLSKSGAGTLVVSGANTFAGSVAVTQGNLTLGANNALPSSTVVGVGGTGTSQLVLNGFSQTISGLNTLTGGTRRVIGNHASQMSVLTINTPTATSFLYAGQIGNGTNANPNRIAVVKSGSGLQELTNTTNLTYTGNTTIQDGALGFAVGNGPLSSYLILDGGVFQSQGTTALTFTRSIGASGLNAFQWTANGGGFSAKDAKLTVNIGGAGAMLNWGSIIGTELTGTLKFGHVTANAQTEFQNSIALNGGTRTISVTDNPATAADIATISGIISDGSAPGSLVKTGPGTLVLSGSDTYTGSTIIQDGALGSVIDNGPATSFIVLDGGVYQGQGTGTVGFNRSLGTSGANAFQWTANGGGFSASSTKLTVNIGGDTRTLNWGSNIGTDLTGALKFGSSSAGAETELQNLINLNGAVRSINVTDNTASAADFATITGSIADGSGSGGVTKTGTGTLILTANNSYTGGTIVSGGILVAAAPAALPGFNTSGRLVVQSGGTLQVRTGNSGEWQLNEALALFGTGNFEQGSTLALETTADVTLSIPLTVSGVALGKAGPATLLLSGANTYNGGTSIRAGTVQLGSNSALGTGTVTLAGGTLSSSDNSPRSLANSFAIRSASVLGNSTNNGTLTITGAVDFTGAPRNLDIQNDVVVTGTSSNGGLGQKTGPGTLTIKGDGNWSSGGVTEIRDGTLVIDGAHIVNHDAVRIMSTIPGGTARVDIRAGSSLAIDTLSANLRVGYTPGGDSSATNIADIAGTLILPAGGSGGAVQLGSNSAKAILNLKPGGLIIAKNVTTGSAPGETELNFDGGTLKASQNSTGFIQNLTHTYVQAGGAIIDSNGFDLGISQSLEHDSLLGTSADGGFTKAGAGTVTLSGANTYDGPTVINQGTLILTGSITGHGVNVNSGATLTGFGSIELSGTSELQVAAGGILSPGFGVGALSISTTGGLVNLTEAVRGTATGALVFELASGFNDTITLSGGAFSIGTGLLAFDDFVFSDAGGLAEGTYTLFDSNAPIVGQLDLAHLSGNIGSFTGTLGFADGGKDLVLIVAVPEPNSAMLLLTAAAGMAGWRRRRTPTK